jgi:prolyl-tRNA editing enzyme YbaK/EbsC (Cys-tRNA(Pro) deacylase)
MNEFNKKISKYIEEHKIDGEHLIFEQSCHSVPEAAVAAKADVEDFVKNICMIDSEGNLIVAIVKGEDRASTSRVAKALGIDRPRIAIAEEMLEKTGYPCGGTPSFGYVATFLIDSKVMEKEIVYSGGGSQNSLIKISTVELRKANEGRVARIRK